MVWVWDWIPRNIPLIGSALVEHVQLALVPILVGLVVAVPLGWLASRNPVARAVLIPTSGLLYTIPSLTLFVLLPGLLGLQVADSLNVIIALAIYTVALLVRSIADALAAVPAMVVAAATAMGFRPGRRFIEVELPLAVPVLIAGLRVATVSNISLVSVGALIGNGGLGEFFTDGIQRSNIVEIVTGIVLIVLLALAADAVLLGIGRLATPWNRVGSGAGGKS